SELASDTSLLENATVTRNELAIQIMTSMEYETDQVDTLYGQILHRPADPTGQSVFVNLLSQGGTQQQVEAQLLGSGEFFTNFGGGTNSGFLNALYQDVLKRPIDPPGLQTWGAALQNGMTRTDLAASILASPEYDTDAVQALYQSILGRAADPT